MGLWGRHFLIQQILACEVFIYQTVSGPSVTYSSWSECSFLQPHEGYEPFASCFPLHIFIGKDRAWPHLSVLLLQSHSTTLCSVTVSGFYSSSAWSPIWVQDRSNVQLLYSAIWQPLSSAPAWIYWAEQTVVCQEVSPHRNIGFTVSSCFQQQPTFMEIKLISLSNLDMDSCIGMSRTSPSQDWCSPSHQRHLNP